MFVRLAAAAAAALAAALAPAQERAAPVQPWLFERLEADGGLSGCMVYFLDFEADGTAWLATSNGLVRYDGYHWRRYGTDAGLPSDNVRCVLVGLAGRLWVGTDRGAGVFAGGHFDDMGLTGQLAGRSVRRIRQDPDGTLWFCCDRWPDYDDSAGLTRWRDGEARSYGQLDGLPSDYVSDCFLDSRGRRFVLTRAGMAEMRGEQFDNAWAGVPPSKPGYVWSIAEAPRFGVVATTRREQMVLRDGRWHRVARSASPREVTKIVATRDGEILGFSDRRPTELLRWSGEGFEAVVDVPAIAHVEVVREAPDGSVWIAGDGTLVRWARRGREWAVYPSLPPRPIADHAGGVWFAGDHRVVGYRDGRWFVVGGGWPPLVPSADGSVWMAARNGVQRWRNGALDRHDLRQGGLESVEHLAADGDGRLWALGSDADGGERYACWLGDGWSCGAIDLQPDERVAWIDADHGALWCVLSGGETGRHRLLRLRLGGVSEVALPEVAQLETSPGVVAAGGALWAFGMFGLYGTGSVPPRWQRVDGLPGRNVEFAGRIGDALWFLTRGTSGGTSGLACRLGGVWTTSPAQVTVPLGRGGDGELLVAGEDVLWTVCGPDDLRHLTLPEPYWPHRAALAADGTTWLGVRGGVLGYLADGVPPETELSGASDVVAGGAVEVSVGGVERWRSRHRGTWFDCSYRLDDGAWSPFHPLRGGVLRLPSPAVGQHVLRVRVRDEGGDVDPHPAELRFAVLPVPLQLRTWFPGAVATGLSVLAALSVLLFVQRRRLRRHADELELTVAQRTDRLRSLIETTSDWVWEIDAGAAYTYCSPKVSELLGWQPAEVVGRSLFDLMTPDDATAFRGRFDAVLAARGAFAGLRKQALHRDGRRVVLESSGEPIVDRSGGLLGYRGIDRDVTVRVAAERDREELQAQLRHAQKMEAIGRLAGGVAHDFNNILTAALGNVEGLRGELEVAASSQRAESHLREIEKAVQRAATLTRQLLTFARRDAARPRAVAVGPLLEELTGMLEGTIREVIELSVAAEPELPLVHIDPGQLEQVVVNLVINASDAMPDGGVLRVRARADEVTTTLAVPVPRPGRYVVLEVTDSGVGIAQGELGCVFEPFFTTKASGRGTGLGLSTALGIVEQAGGCITVESALGEGSRFRVFLPALPPGAEVAVPAESLRLLPRGSESVLVCEDEPGVRELIAGALREQGYRVMQAGRGDEALSLLKPGEEVDLLISDVIMPGMNGQQLAEQLRRRLPSVRVLLISGYTSDILPDTGDLGDGVAFLRKPFGMRELSQRIRDLLDRAES